MTEFTRSISSTRIGESVLILYVEVSKTNTLADGLIERNSFLLDEIESETVHNYEGGDR